MARRGYCSDCGAFVEINPGARHDERYLKDRYTTSRRWYPVPHTAPDGTTCGVPDQDDKQREAGNIEFGVTPREGSN